ncbi:hypothetical protein SPRG_22191 [Saprolegnia parasitica CBS 223.65]|uniref:Adenylate cyclase-associated CAP C-terminal domain-containing protein n=1 Tax=Saprolegnia parasitica (strain CBS 223.65) TaxID=695850 RepID=A0A067CBG2_SAPPC|nr:hypothetical protein SPRG_22191 [Saprolegnia parasitica CBS 223.65]KDO28099.1 hypothetical protein SPRG_22191 [Saprolegnia parasitica CBS 223.65]|eukprot:XP_012201281.1 hypothetical protein SPRG_22191 [Saprolegnia parasitica CBS 223.65]
MLATNTLLASMQRRPAPVTFANASDAVLRVPPRTSGVFASNVARCSLTMDEKVTQVTVTASKEIDIAFVSVISSLELVRCRGVRVAFTGTCRTIVVDACDNVELTVPTQSPTVLHPEEFDVPRRHAKNYKVFYRLWFSLVATTLHYIWTNRNKIKFEAKTPFVMPVAGNETRELWLSCVRAWPRNDPKAPRDRIDAALQDIGLDPLSHGRQRRPALRRP